MTTQVTPAKPDTAAREDRAFYASHITGSIPDERNRCKPVTRDFKPVYKSSQKWGRPQGLSGFTGVIASFSSCQRNLFSGFSRKCLTIGITLLFRKQDEVAGGRDHGELGVGDELESLKGVFKADKIVISEGDENRRFD